MHTDKDGKGRPSFLRYSTDLYYCQAQQLSIMVLYSSVLNRSGVFCLQVPSTFTGKGLDSRRTLLRKVILHEKREKEEEVKKEKDNEGERQGEKRARGT